MSVEQYQRTVNGLDKEIVELEKKKAAKDKEIANLQGKINSTSKSITKTTFVSTRNSKLKQISGWETDIVKKSKESADFASKIADKRKKRAEAYLRLQKAEQEEQKKYNKQNLKIIQGYENRINDLQQQVIQQIALPHSTIANQMKEKYDAFISHAWEDKEDFVDEFVAELEKLNLSVWYDTKRMAPGDSMREKIDDGLKKSRFGIVILSPNYIADGKYWTKSELNGLFQKESIGGKVLIPIWHRLTKKDVMNYSPILADRLALNTSSNSPTEIAEIIKDMIVKPEEEQNG